MSSYLAPAAAARAELREKGSRFLALLEPAVDEAAARARLQAIEAAHRDVSHCCWAWRLGAPPRERCSDAGEPGGTAGPPILRALQTAEISDALLVVVRWFGGTKLGKGGLVRASGGVAREAVAGATTVRRLRRVRVTLELPYAHVGAVQRLIRPPEVELVEEAFGERVRMVLAVADERLAAVREVAAALGLSLEEGLS
ncbi:MAG TPA: YigZ family protein [Thermoanaerobaculia bacterium]|nr:YigZ family protein [Thermoanaerobaculia bacterium]